MYLFTKQVMAEGCDGKECVVVEVVFEVEVVEEMPVEVVEVQTL